MPTNGTNSNKGNRILIVDDNPDIHKDFKKILNYSNSAESNYIEQLEESIFDEKMDNTNEMDVQDISYEIEDAYQGEEALKMVEKSLEEDNAYSLIFMDVRMPPGWNGIETITKIWEKDPFVEVVICTAYSDYSWNEIVYKFGPTDKLLFLKKPFHYIEVKQLALSLVRKWNLNKDLRHLINNLENEVKDRTKQLNKLLTELEKANKELESNNKKLAEISQRDGLTGLLNHAAFHEQLEAVFAESRRHHFPISIIMIDIDNFKDINDSHGHLAGDEVLKKLSRVLKNRFRSYDEKPKIDKEQEILRKYDIAGRYGGDEFSVIIPYCGEKEASIVANRIYKKIRTISFANIPNLTVTCSLGVAILEKDTFCDNSKCLINAADKALYKSKSKGRDQIQFFVYNQDQSFST